jgi:ABC-type multidrug transport system ATPase subunit
VQPFELVFKNLNVVATVDEVVTVDGKDKTIEVKKQILYDCEGIFSPGTFSAVIGPSGCGKTTLLNLMSGRLLSTNLKLDGELYINGKLTNDINAHG